MASYGEWLACPRTSTGATTTPTAIIISVADALGRTGDITQLFVADTFRMFGPFTPKSAWNQANGKVNIDLDLDVNMTITAIRLP